jgi:tellurite resistance protein
MSDLEAPSRLKNFSISWFAMIMGLSGFTITWSRAEHILHFPFKISPVLLSITVAFFIALTLIYIMKIIRYPREVRGEINHPVKLAFLPTYSISLILLSIAFLNGYAEVSIWLWGIGTGMHFLFTLFILSSWIHQTRYEIKHLNPAWFIPVVGNILVPVAGVHYAPADISWFFFSVGLFFWPVLTSIILYRLIFHPSLPERFIPTLFIFIAPPSVAFISWYNLTGTVSEMGRILYFIAIFFFILVVVQIKYFVKIRFFLSWWAYSFPIAAATIATLIMAKETHLAFFIFSSYILLVTLTLLIAVLVFKTIYAVSQKSICIEEEH